MSARWSFRKRRQSSASAASYSRPSFGTSNAITATGQDEALSHTDLDNSITASPYSSNLSSRFARNGSNGAAANSTTGAAALSSSYSLPSRSYIHHAGHVSHEPIHYSSSGVREQTAELSSSFLNSNSPMARQLSLDSSDVDSLPPLKYPATIEETSEPTTPSAEAALLSSLSSHTAPSPTNRRPLTHSQQARSRNQAESGLDIAVEDDETLDANEVSPLLPRGRLSTRRKQTYEAASTIEEQPASNVGVRDRHGHRHPLLKKLQPNISKATFNYKAWDWRKVGHALVIEPASMLPSVFLGLLLNLLDALSYGIILFPLGEEVFADLGPDGVSMFYVSCIVAQLVYSTGSIFRGGVGSEMIEVVPFFHKMTYMIMETMGTGSPDALRATVITSYAMSSIITGLVFFILGAARLGTLVNFFPHSILTGCIGGVGIFLFVTGIEVSARLDGNLEPSLDVMKQLFAAHTVALWIPPLALAIILLVVKHYYDRPWLVPAYYIAITAIFYIVTTAIPSIHMEDLRASGWVFEAAAKGVPFYNFYSYYNFKLVDWRALWMTVPSQLALTFFGILHVPINVPNLAMVVQEDDVSINRELIMHGVSNTLSGCVGSIQNYLVFVNSALFMNTGGNSRLAGYMLAAATFGLWVAGPVVIGYVPVMVVGTLIYMLGIDLTMEALVATYGRLHRLEYFTIIVIALVMGLYDFVVGIGIGIGLACLVYVVQTSRKTVIRAEFSGAVAASTVRRHPRQRDYLHKVGPQIRVVKLGGYLFFGSIVKVEKKIRALIEAEAFAACPIRYLIVDYSNVNGLDFSAAEAFGRMNRILHRREVQLVMAGVTPGSDVGKSLQMVGLFIPDEGESAIPCPKVFEDLNAALESCENEMLLVLTEKQKLGLRKGGDSPPIPIPDNLPSHLQVSPSLDADAFVGSPRRAQMYRAATLTIHEDSATSSTRFGNSTTKWQNLQQPLPLLLQTFQDLTTKNEDFWFRATPYFTQRHFSKGSLLYARGDPPNAFYLVQSGILRADYYLEQGTYHESIVTGTTCGELPFFSETNRTSRVVAETEVSVWELTREKWETLQEREGEVARELLKVGLKLSAERMDAVTSYVLVTAS